ncbi:lipid-binding protein [Prevotella sp. OH937_COT-195]|uniref:lipid-binding protein n=1 Tax=Prevotella sp. OH937_COT-195 TaxID=2491051 RepID=UPI000F65086C|nr:lipid-binding protein [Prevotella sp. OH937_COT-195]RRD02075.1 hypothetical protein EII32_04200 [Prevotella sp. OH937_COT-195]
MKKYISMLMFAAMAVFGLNSCSLETDEEPGGTNVQDMAGFWDVTIVVLNSDGTVTPAAAGEFNLRTYNTAQNVDNNMWMDLNCGNAFWNMKFIIPINYGAKTFSCNDTKYDVNDENAGNVTITEGRVLLKKGHNIHGMPADSIVFNAKFSDDTKNLTYRIAGTRHSGFTE